MLEVIKYLNGVHKYNPKAALQQLEEEFGIKHSIDERMPELVVLNYCQIKSPKRHPITLECRSLVLEMPEYDFGVPAPSIAEPWTVVSRAFDRFFNYGETETAYNALYLKGFEKRDGSLLSFFYHNIYGWLYRTKSMISPVTKVNSTAITWKEMIENAAGSMGRVCPFLEAYSEDNDYTFITEVTSVHNRVVTRYSTEEITLLAIRNNKTGEYADLKGLNIPWWNYPTEHTFESMDDCVKYVSSLPELQEGLVMYNRLGEPVCKVKNPTYVIAHHMKGETGLTENRIVDLIFKGEYSEYLAVFPEDTDVIMPYVRSYASILAEASKLWESVKHIADIKEFAFSVKDSGLQDFMFRKRQGIEFEEHLHNVLPTRRRSIMHSYLLKESV